MVKCQHITITGKVCNYIYLYSEMKHKPKCEMCGKRMKMVCCSDCFNGFRNKILGYICKFCNIVIISNKYTVLKGEIKK